MNIKRSLVASRPKLLRSSVVSDLKVQKASCLGLGPIYILTRHAGKAIQNGEVGQIDGQLPKDIWSNQMSSVMSPCSAAYGASRPQHHTLPTFQIFNYKNLNHKIVKMYGGR